MGAAAKKTAYDEVDEIDEKISTVVRYPKNLPLNEVQRNSYKYVSRMKISMYHPYRVMGYEIAS